jgi:hypothetical protein
VAIVVTGPSLAAYGIANPLARPKLKLVRSADEEVIAIVYDSWDPWQFFAPSLGPSGFAPADLSEPAIVLSLAPGAYTAIVEGRDGGTGVAVAAIYELGRDRDSADQRLDARSCADGRRRVDRGLRDLG